MHEEARIPQYKRAFQWPLYYKAPLLEPSEISQIFKIAVSRSKGSLTISDEFIEDAVNYSGGVPWIAQHVGHAAFFRKSENGNSEMIHLDRDDFQTAIDEVTRMYGSHQSNKVLLNSIGKMPASAVAALKIIWDNPSGITESDVRENIASEYRRYFDDAMIKLREKNIIVKRGSFLQIEDPALRVLIRYQLDKIRTE